MVSVKEAKEIVRTAVTALPPVNVPLSDACRFVLAQNAEALFDLPPFHQSNVDGYAIRLAETNHSLEVSGEAPAGSPKKQELPPASAIRIFTGAPVPALADTIVMQEKVSITGDHITINDHSLVKGMNIRPRGTDIKKGELAMEAGTTLTPAAIGYLASVGIASVNIYPPPSVSIIITGNELVSPGGSLQFGQVFESGSLILHGALREKGVKHIDIVHCDDSLENITRALETALAKSDMVLLTGGVSVGDYDLVSRAADHCGVRTLFHRVKQKPGKPLYFGVKNKKPVFGLPGNPSSVLTCFYEYVLIALNVFLQFPQEKYVSAKLSETFRKPAGLTHFLKGLYQSGEVTILSAQESYRMSSFARANCLVILPEEQTVFEKGSQMEVHLL